MKRILLAMETPVRDLKTVSLLSFWLNKKYGYRPIITTGKNELAGLIRYKPHMIVMPHLRYIRQRELVQYAKRQRTQIAILPSEGLPAIASIIHKFVIGIEEFYPDVDLLMSWGNSVTEHVKTHAYIPQATVVTTGCPRFDVYSPQFDPIIPTKAEFCAEQHIDPMQKIVLWPTNTVYANDPKNADELAETSLKAGRSGDFIKGDYDFAGLARTHQKAYDFMVQVFKQHVQDHPQIMHVVKPHPIENRQPYVDELASFDNVRVLDSAAPLEELLRHRDIQLNWRCTTALESWMTDISCKTITIENSDIQTSIAKDYMLGNDLVDSYPALCDKVSDYLNGGKTSEELIAKRKEYLERCLYRSDKTAGELCADAIHAHLQDKPEPRWTFGNAGTLARYARAQVPTGRWLTMKRDRRHPKYFDPQEIHRWMGRLNRLFSAHVQPADYEIFV